MILVTGGTGTLGRAILPLLGGEVCVISRDEEKQRECKALFPNVDFRICDVRDAQALEDVFAAVRHSVVIHLAALKQCPMGEDFPLEHVKTNILGSDNIVRMCKRYMVAKAILVSTDKACEPVSVYGATKLVAERVFLASGYEVVRAGNITGSRGSVLNVIANASGPVPMTNPNMTRFWIEAADLACFVIESLKRYKGARVCIPEMIACSLKDTFEGTPYTVVGRRRGEKMHECIVSADERLYISGNGYVVSPTHGEYGHRIASDQS
jgi:UDP-N-acetylglucosamine 4,6-dehydratase/5-epimerase